MSDAISRICDEREIEALLVEYCCALDRMDLSMISTLFTDDCVVEFGPDKRLNSRGSSQVAKSLERMWRWTRTSHHLSNVKIRLLEEDYANAISYVIAWHERANKSTATIYGQYHDELRKDLNGWRIMKRVMYMNGCDTGFTVNIHPFERQSAPEGWVPPSID